MLHLQARPRPAPAAETGFNLTEQDPAASAQEAVEKDIRIKVFCTDRTRLPPGVIAAIDKVRPRLLACEPLRCEPSPSSLTPDSPRN